MKGLSHVLHCFVCIALIISAVLVSIPGSAQNVLNINPSGNGLGLNLGRPGGGVVPGLLNHVNNAVAPSVGHTINSTVGGVGGAVSSVVSPGNARVLQITPGVNPVSMPTARPVMVPNVQVVQPLLNTAGRLNAAAPVNLPRPLVAPIVDNVGARQVGIPGNTPAFAPIYRGQLEKGIPGVKNIAGPPPVASAPTDRTRSSGFVPVLPTGPLGIRASGAPISRRDAGSRISLQDGQVLFGGRSNQPVELNVGGHAVKIARSAGALVSKQGEAVRISNLSGSDKGVTVDLGTLGTVAVAPGHELILNEKGIEQSDVLPNDGVGRRNSVIANDGAFATAEIHYPSLIKNTELLRNLFRSKDPADRRTAEKILKTAAAVATIRGGEGFTAQAKAPSNSLRVGQIVESPAGAVPAALGLNSSSEPGLRIGKVLVEPARAVPQILVRALSNVLPPSTGGGSTGGSTAGSGGGTTSGSGGASGGGSSGAAGGASLQGIQASPLASPADGGIAGNTSSGGSGTGRPVLVASAPNANTTIVQNNPFDTTRRIPTEFPRGSRSRWADDQVTKPSASRLGSRPLESVVKKEVVPSPSPSDTKPPVTTTEGPAVAVRPSTVAAFTGSTEERRKRVAIATPGAAGKPPARRPHVAIPHAVTDTIREHPDWIFAIGVVIAILLVATLQLAYVAHRRAVAIEKQVAELNRLNTQLQTARDHAIEGSRLKSEFVANISHEIRTPMSAVLGTIGLLFDTNLDDKQKEIAGVLKDSARSLLDVINDILDFSKIEAGKMHIQNIDFEPASAMREVADIVRVGAREKSLDLVTEIDNEIPEALRGDPFRLRQILLNLASNAVKFTSSGQVTLSASHMHEPGEFVWVRFAVKDTGIGISDEAKRRLFEPFVQADGSTTRQFGGTGLGLSISKRLAELMGGRIELDSNPGKGSEFSVILPFSIGQAVVVAPAISESAEPSASAIGETASVLGTRRVLVAEDSPVLQKIVKHQLERLNLTVDIVGNGYQAIEAAATGAYSLILMDWQMPELDGLQATREIRALESEVASRPIIAMTANAMDGDKNACLSAGMNDYISKPFTMEQLQAVLDKWLPK